MALSSAPRPRTRPRRTQWTQSKQACRRPLGCGWRRPCQVCTCPPGRPLVGRAPGRSARHRRRAAPLRRRPTQMLGCSVIRRVSTQSLVGRHGASLQHVDAPAVPGCLHRPQSPTRRRGMALHTAQAGCRTHTQVARVQTPAAMHQPCVLCRPAAAGASSRAVRPRGCAGPSVLSAPARWRQGRRLPAWGRRPWPGAGCRHAAHAA